MICLQSRSAGFLVVQKMEGAWGYRRYMVNKYGKGAEHVSGPEHDGWSSDIAR